MLMMMTYHSKIEKKKLDTSELKIDLPEIKPTFTKERTNVLEEALMKGIHEALLEQRNKAYKNFVDKLGYIPPTITIEQYPMRFKEKSDGTIEVSQEFKIKENKKEVKNGKSEDGNNDRRGSLSGN